MAEAKITIKAVDEASSVLKNIEHSYQGLVSAFKGAVGFEILSKLAEKAKEAGEAIVRLVETQVTAAKELENLSEKTGISAQRLQVLQFAFKVNAINADALETSLRFLNKAISEHDPKLAKLGVTSRDTFTALMQAAQGIAAIQNPAERAATVMEIFGARGGTKVIPVLLRLASSFGEVSKRATDTGNVLDELALDKLGKLEEQVETLKANWDGFWKSAAVAIAPTADKTLLVLNHLIKIGETLNRTPMIARVLGVVMGLDIREPKAGPSAGPAAPTGESPAEKQAAADALKRTEQMLFEWEMQRRSKLKEIRKPPTVPELTPFGGEFGSGFGLWMALNKKILTPPQPTATAHDFTADSIEKFAEWAKKVKEIARDVRQVMDTIASSMMQGFIFVFANLTNKTQTFGSAMRAIMDSMVQGILASIGQLIASQAIKFLFQLLGFVVGAFNPALGALVGVGGDLTPDPVIGGGRALAPSAGNTYVIQTLSPRDVLGELQSPTGAMRAANSRLFEIAAASG